MREKSEAERPPAPRFWKAGGVHFFKNEIMAQRAHLHFSTGAMTVWLQVNRCVNRCVV